MTQPDTFAQTPHEPASPNGRIPTRAQAFKIALCYTLLGAIWILASGWLLHQLVHDPAIEAWLEISKGWFFIASTAFLLGLVLDRYFRVIRQSVKQVQEGERRLHLLGDHLPDSYVYQYTYDEGGVPHFTYVSAGVECIHGLSSENILRDAKCLHSQIDAEQRDLLAANEMESARTLTDFSMQLQIRRPDGEVRLLQVRSRPRRNAHGQVEWDGVATDITKIRLAVAEARAAGDRLRLFIEHAPAALAMFDRDMCYLAVSPRWISDFHLGDQELLGRCHYDIFPEINDALKAIHRRCMAGEVIRGSDDCFTRTDGTIQWLRWEVRPWRTTGDSIGGIIISSEDITERKRAEEALRQSEEQFRAMFEVASIGLAQADPHTGQWLRVNRKMCEITGYSEAEMLALKIPDITHPEDRTAEWNSFQRVVRREVPSYRMEKRYLHKDGKVAWVNVNMTLLRDAAGEPLRTIATIEEITGRKQAEEERSRLAAAMEQAVEAICITDTDAGILYVNPAFEKTTGYTRQEALGQTPRILKSGKQDEKFYQQLWNVLKSGEVWRGHFINKRKDGTFFEEDAAISPVRNQSGIITNYVAIKLDVTREMALQSEFRQVQKLEAIGQLAGGIAHDFNNILAVILMQTDQALEENLSPTLHGSLADIRKAAERAASLTRQLLLFSRRQVMQPRILDLNEVVTNLAKMLRRILGEDIQLRLDLHGKPLWTNADAGMLDQVLMNLSVNARDAMPSGGRLTVATGEKFVDAETSPTATAGRYVWLSAHDDGCGIPPNILPHIFEPFFTTKEPGKGTGLGLATVFGIVKQHKGWIEVHSEVGQGATFQILLPRSEAEADNAEHGKAKPKPRGGSETILLVEDDVNVRRVARTILERYGYRVLEAIHGKQALAIGEQMGKQIDLLLTDMVLPEGMNGQEIAMQLRSLLPGLKVVFMSGYSPELAGRPLRLQSGEGFIQKPFESEVVLKTIRQCLES
jgi:two-component system cell cycle sensor histidine kinase/response regulator CckA